MDPFETLGVPYDATPDEIRSAYRHLVRDLHPDTRSAGLDPATADEALRRVQAAYDALTTPHHRSVSRNGATTGEDAPFRETERDAEVGRHAGAARHGGARRFPWWIVAIAVMMAIFIITAYAGSVPVSTP